MNIYNALEAGNKCGLRVVQDVLDDIRQHSQHIFNYGEIASELWELHDSWSTVKHSSSFTESSPIVDVLSFLDSDPLLHDIIGGHHQEGLGWNPNGDFCGECSRLSCEGCKQRFKSKEKSNEKDSKSHSNF